MIKVSLSTIERVVYMTIKFAQAALVFTLLLVCFTPANAATDSPEPISGPAIAHDGVAIIAKPPLLTYIVEEPHAHTGPLAIRACHWYLQTPVR